jgi:hypothetical protein
LDAADIAATPANSRYNEQVIEAARLSLANDGQEFRIEPEIPDRPIDARTDERG